MVVKYGDAFEKCPIPYNQVGHIGHHRFLAGSLLDEKVRHWIAREEPEIAYVDPPWNQAMVTSYYKKAGIAGSYKFWDVLEAILQVLSTVRFDSFIEIGKEHVEELGQRIEQSGGMVFKTWEVTYFRDRLSYLIHACWNGSLYEQFRNEDFSGIDDGQLPYKICSLLPRGTTILDPCTGKGRTARAALKYGLRFIGTELYDRRLAHAVLATSKKEQLSARWNPSL